MTPRGVYRGQQHHRETHGRGGEREKNMAAVTSIGLASLTIHAAALDFPSVPVVLSEAFAAGIVLQARSVDFWAGSTVERRVICKWLESMGFGVTVTNDGRQIGAACGYVAARVTGRMFAAGNEWRSVDVSDAAEETWISLDNAMLQTGWASDNG